MQRRGAVGMLEQSVDTIEIAVRIWIARKSHGISGSC